MGPVGPPETATHVPSPRQKVPELAPVPPLKRAMFRLPVRLDAPKLRAISVTVEEVHAATSGCPGGNVPGVWEI